MLASIRTLMDGLIDYAGLFPPSKRSMSDAVAEFGRQRMGTHERFLGKFICPASRLDELTEQGRSLMPGTFATSGYREMAQTSEPWEVSVVLDQPLEQALDAIDAFNARHASEEGGLARIRTIELKVARASEVDDVVDALPEDIQPFFELPRETLDADPRGIITALATSEGLAAKIRCGGVEPDMIPPSRTVARFIATCAAAGVPFKATAGLHHPIRADYPLTYEPSPPRATMHGFINVFIASAIALQHRAKEDELTQVIEETDPSAFRFSEHGVVWRDREITLEELGTTRARFALGYGSCSFSEPLDDLRKLGLLPTGA